MLQKRRTFHLLSLDRFVLYFFFYFFLKKKPINIIKVRLMLTCVRFIIRMEIDFSFVFTLQFFFERSWCKILEEFGINWVVPG